MLIRTALLFSLAAPTYAAERTLTFEKDVRPIVKAHCTHCHGEEEEPDGGVDLRLRRFMDLVLDDGKPLLVPGQPEKSELVQIIRRGDMPKMGSTMPEAE